VHILGQFIKICDDSNLLTMLCLPIPNRWWITGKLHATDVY